MVIGLLGMSKAGKDEFATGFLDKGFKRYAFGDAVKDEYIKDKGYSRQDVYVELKELHRPAIISYAESKRDEYVFHWVDKIKNDIILDIQNGKDVIITDVRRIEQLQFINALKELRDSNVHLIELIRPIKNGGEFDPDKETSHAISYAHYHSLVDSVVYNSSSSEYLYLTANEIILENK